MLRYYAMTMSSLDGTFQHSDLLGMHKKQRTKAGRPSAPLRVEPKYRYIDTYFYDSTETVKAIIVWKRKWAKAHDTEKTQSTCVHRHRGVGRRCSQKTRLHFFFFFGDFVPCRAWILYMVTPRDSPRRKEELIAQPPKSL